MGFGGVASVWTNRELGVANFRLEVPKVGRNSPFNSIQLVKKLSKTCSTSKCAVKGVLYKHLYLKEPVGFQKNWSRFPVLILSPSLSLFRSLSFSRQPCIVSRPINIGLVRMVGIIITWLWFSRMRSLSLSLSLSFFLSLLVSFSLAYFGALGSPPATSFLI